MIQLAARLSYPNIIRIPIIHLKIEEVRLLNLFFAYHVLKSFLFWLYLFIHQVYLFAYLFFINYTTLIFNTTWLPLIQRLQETLLILLIHRLTQLILSTSPRLNRRSKSVYIRLYLATLNQKRADYFLASLNGGKHSVRAYLSM